METDAFFFRLFKQLPQTLFELIGEPAARAKSYRFDAVELKKAFRIDGLFLPKRSSLPLYFVEVQFQRSRKFYANLFAKVFCYLEENDPTRDWVAVAIFPSRSEEPKQLRPYEDLLASKRVRRIYLEDLIDAQNPPVGLGVLQLLFASMHQAEELAPRIVRKARHQQPDGDFESKVVELVEEVLLSRFTSLDREEMRMKFKLHDIRESKVWKEAHNLGQEAGKEEGKEAGALLAKQEVIRNAIAKGMAHKDIAELVGLPLAEIQQLAKK